MHPLGISAGLHGVVLAALMMAAAWMLPPPPPVLRMHLVSSGPTVSSEASQGVHPLNLPSGSPTSAPVSLEPAAWVGAVGDISAALSSGESLGVPSAAWAELVGGALSMPEVDSLPAPTGWARGTQTEGHSPPPLPPSGLIPPQGARWTLSFLVPAEGGYPLSITGIDEGHQGLDEWLETWLRDATFPPSVTGESYRLKWVLVLDVGRPE